MAEGLSPSEVGKEINEHRSHAQGHDAEATGSDRVITIIEAILLALVAVLAAWSGFASAKWGTEGSLSVARAATARTQASRANLEAMETRNLDSSMFNAWLTAYIEGDPKDIALAQRRFRPEYDVAFNAWLATDPFNDPNVPKGPSYMPQYQLPQEAKSKALDAKADRLYAEGANADKTADDYVRTTVLLASVLFLVGISGHFRVRAARIGLVAVGCTILVWAILIIAGSPRPPG